MKCRVRPELKVTVKNREELDGVSVVVTDLEIASNCCNESELTELDLSGCPFLQRLTVGDDCCMNVDRVVIERLNRLETIKVGERSFTLSKTICPKEENQNRSLHLKNCSHLLSLEVGDHSFSDYYVMKMKHLPSLQTIRIGKYGFCYAADAHFVGMCDVAMSEIELPSLEIIELGELGLCWCHSIRFEGMDCLSMNHSRPS